MLVYKTLIEKNSLSVITPNTPFPTTFPSYSTNVPITPTITNTPIPTITNTPFPTITNTPFPKTPTPHDCQGYWINSTCPQDCQVGPWVNVGTCDRTTGTQQQTRSTTAPALNGGNECPPLTRPTTCPRDCQYSWTNWSTCSVTCGGGTQTRDIIISTEAKDDGVNCPSSSQIQNCNEIPCFPLGTTGLLIISGSGIIAQGTFQNMKIELIGGGGDCWEPLENWISAGGEEEQESID